MLFTRTDGNYYNKYLVIYRGHTTHDSLAVRLQVTEKDELVQAKDRDLAQPETPG